MDLIYEPWPWYVAGPLIALVMFALLLVGKQFGMSSNLRTACAAVGAGKAAENFISVNALHYKRSWTQSQSFRFPLS
jgi:hypothetical protein